MPHEDPQPPDQLATAAERRAAAGIPEVDLTSFAVTEILDLNRYLRSLDREARRFGAEPTGPRSSIDFYSRYAEAVIQAISELPQRDPALGAAVIAGMADSPVDDDRADAATLIPPLLRGDHDTGLRVFATLLRDPIYSVRCEAQNCLDGIAEAIQDPDDPASTQPPLAPDEIMRLRFLVSRSERNGDFHRPGELVLQRLLSPPATDPTDSDRPAPDASGS